MCSIFPGELGGHEESRFLEHANRCPHCRLRLNALSSIQAELKMREKDIPEIALSSRDGKELRKLARRQVRAWPWKGGVSFPRIIRAGGILAAGVLLVILGYRLSVKMSTPEPIREAGARWRSGFINRKERSEKRPSYFPGRKSGTARSIILRSSMAISTWYSAPASPGPGSTCRKISGRNWNIKSPTYGQSAPSMTTPRNLARRPAVSR